MLDRGSPFRGFISLLLAVVIPLCCCSLKSWLGGQAACHGGIPLVVPTGAPDDPLPGCHRHAKAEALGDEKTEPPPAFPSEPMESPAGPCTCGKHYIGSSGVEKPGPDLSPPVVLAVIPVLAPDLAGAALAVGAARHGQPPLQPQTSLLRLHCALIL